MAPRRKLDMNADERFTDVVDQLAGGYKTIGQMVYAVLKEAILSGAFAPGEWLRQEALAAAIGVSRIPVRTALLQLESEGLVSFHPHRGARVRTLTEQQVNEIYRLRKLLETYALGQSLQNVTKERAATLKALAKQLDKQPEGGEFLDLRVKFYRELYDAENNPLLVQLIEELRNTVGRYLLGFRFDGDHRHRHLELAEQVAQGDLDGAEAWLRSHFEQVRKGMILALKDVDSEASEEAGDAVDGVPVSKTSAARRRRSAPVKS